MAEARQQILTTLVTNPQSAAPLSVRLFVGKPAKRGTPMVGVRLIAEGGTGGYVYAATGLAAIGGTLNTTTGQITGTWTAQGHFTGTCTVQDSSATASPPTTWSVDIASPMSVVAATPPPGELTVPYSYTFAVAGALGAVTWTKASGTLPAGLTLSSAGVLSGTPTAPHGRSYARLLATDSTGATLATDVVVDVAELITEILPAVETVAYSGGTVIIEIEQMWRGGVRPFTVVPAGDPNGWPALGLRTRRQRPDGRWVIAGRIPYDVVPAGRQRDVTQLWFAVTDALGKVAVIHPSIAVLQPAAGIDVARDGTVVGQVPFRFNFTGSAVSSVSASLTQVTVTVDQPDPLSAIGLSVLGRSTASSGAPASIVASANDRVLARTAGALGWVQVTPAMLSFSPVTDVTATPPIVSSGGPTPSITHAASGVTAGVYDRVTVNATGHVTAGTQDFTTTFTRSVAASTQYNASDFSSMSASTDVVRITGSAGGASTFNEFYASGTAGQTVFVINDSTTSITFKHNSPGGTATAKWIIGADFTLQPGHGLTAWRDGTASAWRIVGSY